MKKPIYKRWWFWTLSVLVALFIAVRLLLDPIAAHFTQVGLNKVDGYTGKFSRVHVALFPFGYWIYDLELRQNDSKIKEPLVYIKQLYAEVIPRKLLRGEVIATASIGEPKFVMGLGDFKMPTIEGEKVEKKAKEAFNMAKAFADIVPFRVDRFEVRKGQVLVVDATEKSRPQLWVSELELAVDNIFSRRSLDEKVPLGMTMSATIQKSGKMTMMASADPLFELPAFTGQAEIKGLKLEDMYGFTEAKAGLSAHGTFDCYVNFNSADGKLAGAIKPVIKNASIDPADKGAGNAIKAAAVNAAIDVLSDNVPGRHAIATTLPIKGTITHPDPQIWPTILGVVRNAFVQGLAAGFQDLPPETADKKENPIKQAVEALRKDRPAPKAQPQQTRR